MEANRAATETLPLPFRTFRTVRWHMMREIEGLSDEVLLTIPNGRSDNILWNVGHLLCSLCRLTYGRCGLPLPIPDSWFALYGKGTRATDWSGRPAPQPVLDQFIAMPSELEEGYVAGKFTEYDPVTLPSGHALDSIEEAIAFHCFHEGLHLGRIMTLKESLGLATSE